MKIGTVDERLDVAQTYLQRKCTWYVLRTAPLKERTAEHILREAGFAAFVPIERRWVRVSRHARRRRPRAFNAMPRYVLVGCDGPMPWHRLRELRVTQGALGSGMPFKRDGRTVWPEPMTIPQKTVNHWILASCEDPLAKSGSLPVGGHTTLQVGQEARVGDGPFASFSAVIQKIEGADAYAEVQIFGRATPVWIPLDALDPV
jgi:transcription antitermination factor NusG